MAELWGAETRKAVDNFPVSGEPIPVAVVHWLGRIKGAAARVNAELGLLDADVAERIAAAADEVAAGEHDDQFPIDVFQTGSGTSSNMNANEVIAHARRRGRRTPTTTSTWASRPTTCSRPPSTWPRSTAPSTSCCPRSSALERLARGQGRGVRRRRQGRPHAPDGRRAGHARPGVRRLRRAGPRGRAPRRVDALAGARPDPARRHRHRHRPQHASRVRRPRARAAGRPTPASTIPPPADPFEAQANRDALVETSGALKVGRRLADQDRQRPALDGLRAARRARRDLSCPSCRRARRSCPARSTR